MVSSKFKIVLIFFINIISILQTTVKDGISREEKMKKENVDALYEDREIG